MSEAGCPFRHRFVPSGSGFEPVVLPEGTDAAGTAARASPPALPAGTPDTGTPGYRDAMTPREPGTPSLNEVEQDFTVPGDADLRPVVDEGGDEAETDS